MSLQHSELLSRGSDCCAERRKRYLGTEVIDWQPPACFNRGGDPLRPHNVRTISHRQQHLGIMKAIY